MTAETQVPANGQAEDGRVLTLSPEAPHRPKIMTREEAKQLRKGLKARVLKDRTTAMKKWAESFLPPEAGTQTLAHLESIDGSIQG